MISWCRDERGVIVSRIGGRWWSRLMRMLCRVHNCCVHRNRRRVVEADRVSIVQD